jgi:hypothetical protein
MESSENMKCRNEEDPFSLDPLSDFEPNRIINIGKDCFDLKALFNWVYNLQNLRNPLTNIEFTAVEIQSIGQAAMDRYGMEVEYVSLDTNSTIKAISTSLTTWKRLFINGVNMIAENFYIDNNTLSFYQCIMYVVENHIVLEVEIDDDVFDFFSEKLRLEITTSQHEDFSNKLRIRYRTSTSGHFDHRDTSRYRHILNSEKFPTDDFDDIVHNNGNLQQPNASPEGSSGLFDAIADPVPIQPILEEILATVEITINYPAPYLLSQNDRQAMGMAVNENYINMSLNLQTSVTLRNTSTVADLLDSVRPYINLVNSRIFNNKIGNPHFKYFKRSFMTENGEAASFSSSLSGIVENNYQLTFGIIDTPVVGEEWTTYYIN